MLAPVGCASLGTRGVRSGHDGAWGRQGAGQHTHKKLVKGLGRKPGLPFPAFLVLVFFACLRASQKLRVAALAGGMWWR